MAARKAYRKYVLQITEGNEIFWVRVSDQKPLWPEELREFDEDMIMQINARVNADNSTAKKFLKDIYDQHQHLNLKSKKEYWDKVRTEHLQATTGEEPTLDEAPTDEEHKSEAELVCEAFMKEHPKLGTTFDEELLMFLQFVGDSSMFKVLPITKPQVLLKPIALLGLVSALKTLDANSKIGKHIHNVQGEKGTKVYVSASRSLSQMFRKRLEYYLNKYPYIANSGDTENKRVVRSCSYRGQYKLDHPKKKSKTFSNPKHDTLTRSLLKDMKERYPNMNINDPSAQFFAWIEFRDADVGNKIQSKYFNQRSEGKALQRSTKAKMSNSKKQQVQQNETNNPHWHTSFTSQDFKNSVRYYIANPAVDYLFTQPNMITMMVSGREFTFEVIVPPPGSVSVVAPNFPLLTHETEIVEQSDTQISSTTPPVKAARVFSKFIAPFDVDLKSYQFSITSRGLTLSFLRKGFKNVTLMKNRKLNKTAKNLPVGGSLGNLHTVSKVQHQTPKPTPFIPTSSIPTTTAEEETPSIPTPSIHTTTEEEVCIATDEEDQDLLVSIMNCLRPISTQPGPKSGESVSAIVSEVDHSQISIRPIPDENSASDSQRADICKLCGTTLGPVNTDWHKCASCGARLCAKMICKSGHSIIVNENNGTYLCHSSCTEHNHYVVSDDSASEIGDSAPDSSQSGPEIGQSVPATDSTVPMRDESKVIVDESSVICRGCSSGWAEGEGMNDPCCDICHLYVHEACAIQSTLFLADYVWHCQFCHDSAGVKMGHAWAISSSYPTTTINERTVSILSLRAISSCYDVNNLKRVSSTDDEPHINFFIDIGQSGWMNICEYNDLKATAIACIMAKMSTVPKNSTFYNFLVNGQLSGHKDDSTDSVRAIQIDFSTDMKTLPSLHVGVTSLTEATIAFLHFEEEKSTTKRKPRVQLVSSRKKKVRDRK